MLLLFTGCNQNRIDSTVCSDEISVDQSDTEQSEPTATTQTPQNPENPNNNNNNNNNNTQNTTVSQNNVDTPQTTTGVSQKPDEIPNLGDDNKTFGDALETLGAYNGYFEGDSQNITVTCVSGTENAYTLEGTTLTFTAINENSVYSVSGKFRGNIIIDTGDSYKFELELNGFSLLCNSVNPITVNTGDKVTVKAKKDTNNYIYDMRAAVDSTNTSLYAGAIHSEVDLEISGKGLLAVVSENNNGIHTKDDLEVKNLTLLVACVDNALKGNDSVTVTDANTTLIASGGDCIKTSNSDISEKGNQRGTISINGGSHNLYAACDGIDAAYDAVIVNNATVLNIFTDKYSNYTKDVITNSSTDYYVRNTSQNYSYSIKFINSATESFEWVNASYHSKTSGGRTTYYYYSFPTLDGYDKIQVFVYKSGTAQQQEETYYVKSDVMTLSTSYDTLYLKNSSFSWTNYSSSSSQFPGGGGGFPGGPGGMGDGNSDKGDHSTKGIKAANEIVIHAGAINIKSYDDALHAGSDTALENGKSALGNITINGGALTLYSNDDGIHADALLKIAAGSITVTNAYEGLEGTQVEISGGFVSVNCKDDGINATTTSGTAITISGGEIYIYCTGDGIDSNSRTANVGIVITGGKTVVISNSSMNSSLDTENGYTYTAGTLVAIMPQGGMSSEATHCNNFSNIGKSTKLSLTSGKYLVVETQNDNVTVQMPVSLSALVVVLGDNAASITSATSTSQTLDINGIAWH